MENQVENPILTSVGEIYEKRDKSLFDTIPLESSME